ncbi:hypothetical protein [Streptomyces cinereoruber]|uniref:hypothetical protein n=1 Tax=Streptomyces cinereoruber TaxID=67260 RepID=UPI00364978D7
MTDPDGYRANLSFEVWTADAAGKPVTKVKPNDSTYGVIVSPYVASGGTAKVDVPAGKLALNTNYVFRINAYDGSLYETVRSPWAKFRVELPVDLTLPTPNCASPNPNHFDAQQPHYYQTKPLGQAGTPLSARPTSAAKDAVEQCSEPDADGRQVCFGKSTPAPEGKAPQASAKAGAAATTAGVEWCDTDFESILATGSSSVMCVRCRSSSAWTVGRRLWRISCSCGCWNLTDRTRLQST